MKVNPRYLVPALLLLIASAARAEDVTFNVPVDVKSLEAPIKTVAVYCRLFSADTPPQQIAAGYSPFAALDATGNYNGTLTVKLSGATAGQTPSYRCSLVLAYANQTVYSNDLIISPATDDFGRPQPGTPYVPVVGIAVGTPGATGSSGTGPLTTSCLPGYGSANNRCFTTCTTSAQCVAGYSCNGGGQCVAASGVGTPSPASGTTPGVPGYRPGFTSCSASAQCATGYSCAGNQCVPQKVIGAACTTASDCSSGFCQTGRCAMPSLGSACSPGQMKSGAGQMGAASGGLCQNCPANSTCTCPTGTAADGLGQCVAASAAATPGSSPGAGTTFGAAGYRPGFTSCTASAQCAAGYSCANTQCVQQKAAGAACSAASDCTSGFCQTGRCAIPSLGSACSPGQMKSGAGQMGAASGGLCQNCPANSTCTCPSGTVADGLGQCVTAAGTGTPAAASPAAGTSRTPDPRIADCLDSGGTWIGGSCRFGVGGKLPQ